MSILGLITKSITLACIVIIIGYGIVYGAAQLAISVTQGIHDLTHRPHLENNHFIFKSIDSVNHLPGISRHEQIDWTINPDFIASGPGVIYDDERYLWPSAPESLSTDLATDDQPVFLRLRLFDSEQAGALVETLNGAGLSSYIIEEGAGLDVHAGPANNLDPNSPLLQYLLNLGFE
ncbi:hypothetical protein PuT2_11960 [Pusillimonas sp. T2]|uniref:hypothetical protein n=1 Tax=Pusillimonas sp. T2 TaxID=1548123 RepID=UPI000B9C9EBA|nr:hypothetical protein [Pusillimonas sp. T2]OXR48675.1 hypothetical protein PuT2_11960 [Pusillimonas sp. T2]